MKLKYHLDHPQIKRNKSWGNPAKSKAQFRFMKAVEQGDVKAQGLSKKEAKEFTSKNKSYKKLPEKKKGE